MKKIFLLSVFLLFLSSGVLLPSALQSDEVQSESSYTFGAGIRSDGIGLDLRVARELALTSALRFSVGKNPSILAHINGLFLPESWEIVSEDLGRFPLYGGIGVILGGEGGFLLGMRFPFGVEHHLQGTPFRVFLEFAPYFHFIRQGKGAVTFYSGEGSFGIIYFF
jgi:hypothetical protein